MNYDDYDTIIVAFSGGKDSSAVVYNLIEEGVDMRKVELWHHDVDGMQEHFMDWPETREFCREVAKDLNLPLYMSWREGGFKQEMLRKDQPTGPVFWERPDGTLGTSGGKGPNGTRRMFPQVSADLRVRWCSAYLKIDVMSAAINNQERFIGQRTLVVTGERAEESPNRAKYKSFEDHRCNTKKRTVHHFRPILDWTEEQVWDILVRNTALVHPAYWLGWGRLSCMTCIFGDADQWASAHARDPGMVGILAGLEKSFGKTIKRTKSIEDLVEEGRPYARAQAISNFRRVHPLGPGGMPDGAYSGGSGPN